MFSRFSQSSSSVTCRPNKPANFLPFSSPFLIKPSCHLKTTNHQPKIDSPTMRCFVVVYVDWLFWGHLASQKIRHHFSRFHNATNSSFEHASFQSCSGETISRISIHSRAHVSIFSNKTPPTTCKSFRRGKSPSRSNSNRIYRKSTKVSESYQEQLYTSIKLAT